MDYKSFIRVIDGFPVKGISFKDISTLLLNGEAFSRAIEDLFELSKKYDYDKIIAPEARGFIVGSALSVLSKKPLVLLRKKNKLPAETYKVNYKLEYGDDFLEVHKDAISAIDKFLIVDDLLATGGTVKAICDLINSTGASVSAALFLIELSSLKGRERFSDVITESLVEYEK